MADDSFTKQLTLQDIKSHKEDVLPEQIGPYLIEALIAKSHYSQVFLAYNSLTKQVVALKVLLPEYLDKKAMVSSFINEGSIIQMASHPNIVKLYEQGKWEGGFYLAMEFIRGISLRQFIQQHSLSIKRCLDIVLQVCYALCHLHAHGIIHGDLKPENILIAEDGEVKVLDFGIAKLQNSHQQTPSLAGTPSYMSPEHKQNVHNLTYSSDIYALGIIAYELITGKLSFGVIHIENIPKTLRPLIEKCLKKSLDERYSDVVDLIYDLSEFFKKEQYLDALNVSQQNHKDDLLKDSLEEAFPIPEAYLDPLDFGFSRRLNVKSIHPLIAHVFDDNSLLLAIIESQSAHYKKNIEESMVYGFIKYYMQELGIKKFSFKDFLVKINSICFKAHLKVNFSCLHTDSYLDEVHFSHGGFLNPILSKNKKVLTPPVGDQNPLLGSSPDEPSISTHSFEVGDQIVLHSLKNSHNLEKLIKEYQSISSYSSQILSETLIKKSESLSLDSLMTCLKVK
jgi:serine/threonine protein kinase